MSERVFNLFLICEDMIIKELGVASHETSGGDEEKIAFLRARVETDFLIATRYPVPDRFRVVFTTGTKLPRALPYQAFQYMANAGRPLEVFEEILEELAAPPDPMTCVTPVIGGRPEYDIAAQMPQPPDPSVQVVLNQGSSSGSVLSS